MGFFTIQFVEILYISEEKANLSYSTKIQEVNDVIIKRTI